MSAASGKSGYGFVESLRAALKSSWDLRFGQFLLHLGARAGRRDLSWLRHVSDHDLERAVLEETLPATVDWRNNEDVAQKLAAGGRVVAGPAARRDIMVFLSLADAFCEALRVAKEENPGMRFGEILESAIAPAAGNREGQLHYQYREDSVRLLHRWATHKSMFLL